jgi:hypothetical protein
MQSLLRTNYEHYANMKSDQKDKMCDGENLQANIKQFTSGNRLNEWLEENGLDGIYSKCPTSKKSCT